MLHRALLGCLSLLAVAACASGTPIMRGEAHAAEGAISIETAEWTYSVPLDGVTWIDSNNSWHEEGRPECLMPTEGTVPVEFAAVEVTVEGVTWRQVVWVDCR